MAGEDEADIEAVAANDAASRKGRPMNRGDWIIAAASVALGSLLPMLAEWVRGHIERAQRRRDRRDDFQRDTLLALQDALYLFVEAMEYSIADYQRAQAGQPPVSPTVLGVPWQMAVRTPQARITQLTARVGDQHLREIVREFRDTFSESFSVAETAVEGEVALKRIRAINNQANVRIGELLRHL